MLDADLLVLDDLGAERATEWVDETMNSIVNTRYNDRRATIFTSNYEDGPDPDALDSLLARVGFRMHSRLRRLVSSTRTVRSVSSTYQPSRGFSLQRA
ncbi:MAG: hypothetical protein OXU72_05665 [Gammaproteobacteria bacterium]|nr:hypothetical protein [Gammaproteobacteria bacterium]